MKDKTNKSFWQRVAKLYAPFMGRDRRLYEEICLNIRPHLTSETDLLEIATGPGILAFMLADTGANMIAADYSEKMIEEAQKKKYPANLKFEVADATLLPYKSESFHVVIIANALHIMPDPDKALSEIHRVLRPGGLLIAPTFVHGESEKLLLRSQLMELIGFHTYSKWNAKQLSEYVKMRGFQIQEQNILGSRLMPLSYIEAVKQ